VAVDAGKVVAVGVRVAALPVACVGVGDELGLAVAVGDEVGLAVGVGVDAALEICALLVGPPSSAPISNANSATVVDHDTDRFWIMTGLP
jgi:hypothetical protein